MTAISEELSDEKLSEMLTGLEGATPGPWEATHGTKRISAPAKGFLTVAKASDGLSRSKDYDTFQIDADEASTNAAHIARCDPDTIRALILEIQSLRSGNGGEVRVKALEWKDWHSHQRANTILGAYDVRHDGDEPEEWSVYRNQTMIACAATEELAVNAAQDDFTAIIRSALDIKP